MAWTPDDITAAIRHLRRKDQVLKGVISQVGPFTLQRDRDHFKMLVRSIISQQISGKAAQSIRQKLEALVAPEKINPGNLAALTQAQLRSAGVSPQKARYLHDLAAKVDAGTVRLSRTPRMTDGEVIAELVQVTGIGVWTAQMFLMFSLGRLDVFPYDDLGIRTAIRNLYRLPELPDKQQSLEIANPWRPYATVASWYCWRSLDLTEVE
ncbi:MAG: DNA-3-methyladenine glycosylase 2 family protein [Planctomycetes bacterium]|nr:DNA-3-methyladenine glycosylase 2 family protein [Planctomycetota bacterium]